MSFTMTERSDSPTRNGLAQIFSKARNRDKRGKDSAGNSIKSTDDGNGIRGSVEDAIEKRKGSTSTSTEDDGESNGIKKLVPMAIGSKRRKKKEKEKEEEEQRASAEVARGRSVADRGTLRNDAGSPVNESGDGSSLITYDSDTES
jgi:hypothetical protein